MVGLGGLEPPTSPLSVVTEPCEMECDCLLSYRFSAPVQAILAPIPLLRFAMILHHERAQNGAQPHGSVRGIRKGGLSGVGAVARHGGLTWGTNFLLARFFCLPAIIFPQGTSYLFTRRCPPAPYLGGTVCGAQNLVRQGGQARPPVGVRLGLTPAAVTEPLRGGRSSRDFWRSGLVPTCPVRALIRS
jgi:hypothetical protein